MERTAAELLREARLRRGLTARELVTLSGVPQSTVSRIEAGKTNPSFDVMRRLLLTLGFESSDRLRPQVSDAPLIQFMDDYQAGRMTDKSSFDRMRIAAQTSPVLSRKGVQRRAASLDEVIDWAKSAKIRFAVSGLEACSDETSFQPIVYIAGDAEISFPSPAPGNRGVILIPLSGRAAHFVRHSGAIPVMPRAWGMMDAIASPGRQSDVALELLENYRAELEAA